MDHGVRGDVDREAGREAVGLTLPHPELVHAAERIRVGGFETVPRIEVGDLVAISFLERADRVLVAHLEAEELQVQ